ncbi:hypothetical protein FOA43_000221 [Brettanomyces nanus]|uniref:Uncharacterized protein n=1 Tax=Eeniella nana TaxID=13502 RepID=A0A875RWN6_EENNA|nr:uncharacterized protein FOA43_000221 [Brettanomyces nanus]QPG72918.1 hypothetical protein FOA43_000221 [Brettanomyces nanus]
MNSVASDDGSGEVNGEGEGEDELDEDDAPGESNDGSFKELIADPDNDAADDVDECEYRCLIQGSTEVWIFLGTSMVIYGVFLLSGGNEHISGIHTGTGTRSHAGTASPLLGSTTSIYGSIGGSSAAPSTINIDQDMEDPEFTSIQQLTTPHETPSMYGDGQSTVTSNGLAQNLTPSASLPVSSAPRSLSNANEFFTPLIKSTTENLHSAGRKVSGFFKKSMDTFHTPGNTRISDEASLSRASSCSHRKSITCGSGSFRQTSPTNQGEVTKEMPEYVSFGSIRDSSSFVNNHDGIADADIGHNEGDIGDPAVDTSISSGLNLLMSIRGRDKSSSQSPHKVVKHANSSQSLQADVYRSYSMFSQFGKAAADKLSPLKLISPSKQRNGLHIKTKTSSNNAVDTSANANEDYNSNNMFNYSLSNTIDEIQNQMNTIDSKTLQISKGDLTPLIHSSEGSALTSQLQPSQQIPSSLSTNNASEPSPINTRYQSLKRDERNILHKNRKVGRNFTTGMLRGHSRALSFEQSELLSELKK